MSEMNIGINSCGSCCSELITSMKIIESLVMASGVSSELKLQSEYVTYHLRFHL